MKKVLVVDDNPDITPIVAAMLKNCGFAVMIHDNGFGVREIVDDYKPDLVLLDIMLPGKSGTEICNELKAISNHPPIILFSAHSNESKATSLCSADGFIGKPFEMKELIDTVRSLAA